MNEVPDWLNYVEEARGVRSCAEAVLIHAAGPIFLSVTNLRA